MATAEEAEGNSGGWWVGEPRPLRSARIESAKAGLLAQRVVRHERMERPPLPNNCLARGSENLSERGGFFIVERHALARVSKEAERGVGEGPAPR